MVLIVAHGIMGTDYRQDIVVDGGAQGNGDVKVLHDLRRHLSTQYGDGTPVTGWALSPAPSGIWLNRVERAFDANYAPAYLMVSVLIPRGQQLKDDTVLNKISRAMILNHSKFINQNVIQYECDWRFLNPLSQDIEGCLVPFDGAVSNYAGQTDGEVAYYDGDLSKMMREMWNDKFTRFGTVFCGKGLLATDREYPDIKVGLESELQNENVDGENGVPLDTNESEKSVPIEKEQSDNPTWTIIVTTPTPSVSGNYSVSQDEKDGKIYDLCNNLKSKGLEVKVMPEDNEGRIVSLIAEYPQWIIKILMGSQKLKEELVSANELERRIEEWKRFYEGQGLEYDKREDSERIVKLHFIKPNESSINPPVYGPPVVEKRIEQKDAVSSVKAKHGKKAKMFRDIFSFKGRIRRTEYGLTNVLFFAYFLFLLVLGVVYAVRSYEIYPYDSSSETVFALAWMASIIPLAWILYAQGAKRCHDIGHNGWWQLIPFYVFWMLFKEGEKGANKFGHDPKSLIATEHPAKKKDITSYVLFGIWEAVALILMVILISDLDIEGPFTPTGAMENDTISIRQDVEACISESSNQNTVVNEPPSQNQNVESKENGKKSLDGLKQNYNKVDMGFLSEKGNKFYWADGNLTSSYTIASSRSDKGALFYWGDTALTYKGGYRSDYIDEWYNGDGWKKSSLFGGPNPPMSISGTDYDIAHVKIGGNWRLPTKKEFQDLIKNSTITKATEGGRKGYLFTSKINGNTLFFPRVDSWQGGDVGAYWSGTLVEKDITDAYYIFMTGSTAYIARLLRCDANAVRPVFDEGYTMNKNEGNTSNKTTMASTEIDDKIIISSANKLFLCLTWENVKDGGKMFYEKYEVKNPNLKHRAKSIIEWSNGVGKARYQKVYEKAKMGEDGLDDLERLLKMYSDLDSYNNSVYEEAQSASPKFGL